MRRSISFIGGLAAALALVLLMAPSGGFPSRPRFQSVGIAATAPTGTGGLDVQRLGVGIGGAPAASGAIDAAGTITARGDVSVLAASTTNPTIEFNMQDAAANNNRWQLGPQAETFVCRALNDAGSTINRWCEVERTGAVIDSVNFLGTAIRANGVPVARASASQSAPSGATMLPGDSITVSKLTNTARASTISPAIDPHLQVTSLPAGHYRVETFLSFFLGNGGARFRIDSPNTTILLGTGFCNSASTSNIVETSLEITCSGPAGTEVNFLEVGSTKKAMATGTISIFWAQNTSDVTSTTLSDTSYLKVTRLN